MEVTDSSDYTLITKTVDENCCNPLKLWHDIGEPAYPTHAETELIKSAAWPLTESTVISAKDGVVSSQITVNRNGVVYFTLTKRQLTSDRGYDYDKVVSYH